MVKREKEYLKKKKKEYLRGAIIWFAIMFSVFIIGYILNKTRKNVFTLVAALLVLPVAQYATQLLAIWKFKDPDIEISNSLESIQGDYALFHSALMPDTKEVINFDHIIVTGKRIYCIIDKPYEIGRIKSLLDQKLKAKGIPLKIIQYVNFSELKNEDKLLKEVETVAKQGNQKDLEEYTQLIAQMMM